MKRPLNRDLYSILGVDPSASQPDIREAYLLRARVIHPDRFDSASQSTEWRKANEMLAELNEAYSILRIRSTRKEYDASRGESRATAYSTPPPSSPPPRPKPSPPAPSPFELGDLTPGYAYFSALPKRVQECLIRRQQNREKDQYKLCMYPLKWNFLFLFTLLCWFIYLFAATAEKKWAGETLFWHSSLTILAALLIGRNIANLRRWSVSTLKSCFYVTPLYFIKTEYDMVSFWPISSLQHITFLHNEATLTINNSYESISFPSRAEAEKMYVTLRLFDGRMREAYTRRQFDYFTNHDDFHRVPRTTDSKQPTLLPLDERILVYSMSIIICGLAFAAALAVNADRARKYWLLHPSPTRDYANAITIEPTAPIIKPSPSYPVHVMPYTGSVKTFTNAERVAPFEIMAAQGNHYLVKLVESYTDAPVMTVFVRSGTTVSVKVPLGSYEVRYACGYTWYGYEYLFGPDTAYSKADETFCFATESNQYKGYSISLYEVKGGNLNTSPIRADQF